MKPPSGDCRVSRAKVGGGDCELLEFRRVEGGGSNGRKIEVVKRGGCEIRELRRIGGGDGVNLEIIGVRRFCLSVSIGCELGEESIVLLSSSKS